MNIEENIKFQHTTNVMQYANMHETSDFASIIKHYSIRGRVSAPSSPSVHATAMQSIIKTKDACLLFVSNELHKD